MQIYCPIFFTKLNFFTICFCLIPKESILITILYCILYQVRKYHTKYWIHWCSVLICSFKYWQRRVSMFKMMSFELIWVLMKSRIDQEFPHYFPHSYKQCSNLATTFSQQRKSHTEYTSRQASSHLILIRADNDNCERTFPTH